MKPAVAVGPGPRWWRRTLAVLGAVYFIALVKHPPQIRGLRAIGFFTESTCLFPRADNVSLEYRLDAWSCRDLKWEPIDPRAYFPIQADDKESRFQRLGYFYQPSRAAMNALDEFIYGRHDTSDDGFTGQIGGIRVSKWTRPIPHVGDDVPRYEFTPLVPPPADQTKETFFTKASVRKARCASVR
ncbi:MAG TPA: hypothetical protein VFQ65_22695 [Kofleriaceae bacterium]|nr:hypothetical protein [Kofleriaceae bacterium]